MIEFADFGMSTIHKAMALAMKVKLTPEVLERGHLTEAERAQLRPMAPYAAPYVHGLMQHAPKVMAIGFALALVMQVAERASELKHLRAAERREGPAAEFASTS